MIKASEEESINKVLPRQTWGPGLDASTQAKILSVLACACNLNSGEAEAGGAYGLAIQAD